METNTLTSTITRESILAVGATNLDQLSPRRAAIKVVRNAYMAALRDDMIVALVAMCLALLALFGMEWLKVGVDTRTQRVDDEENIGPSKELNVS